MHKRNGFTIIELLIVLVLVGLMVLIVFLAVPATQRAARNTERHKDAGLLLASVVDYRAQSSNGALPESCNNTQAGCLAKETPLAYYDNQATTPVVEYWRLDAPYSEAAPQPTTDDDEATEKVMIYSYAICNDAGNQPTGQYASPQSVVVQYAIETFSGPALQCKGI